MPKVDYTAFLRSAYEGLLKRTGSPPDGVIVHPNDFEAVVEALSKLDFDLTVIEDTQVSPGRVSVFKASPSTPAN